MDEEAIELLKWIKDKEKIGLYELVDEYAKCKKEKPEDIFERVVRIVYFLTGEGFVEMNLVEGEDGPETFLKSTEFGKNYLLTESLRK